LRIFIDGVKGVKLGRRGINPLIATIIDVLQVNTRPMLGG